MCIVVELNNGTGFPNGAQRAECHPPSPGLLCDGHVTMQQLSAPLSPTPMPAGVNLDTILHQSSYNGKDSEDVQQNHSFTPNCRCWNRVRKGNPHTSSHKKFHTCRHTKDTDRSLG
ncbi:hypothetical protein ANANG_G00224990 [Anguilla anguilla]|uniref:Uncharacterized protein n=1 Tax=Anguilla anguilla TaxID=7936 RepID=A0A9D3LY85_ANGAN|nr:hypothetical protein ANANG_G00224990 [Anguilla anguilla]